MAQAGLPGDCGTQTSFEESAVNNSAFIAVADRCVFVFKGYLKIEEKVK